MEETEGEEPANYHLLCVNFDQILVKLLREVKYFVLLGLQVSGKESHLCMRPLLLLGIIFFTCYFFCSVFYYVFCLSV